MRNKGYPIGEPGKFYTLEEMAKLRNSHINDGGSAAYYELPKNARELSDLIEHRDMNYNMGNIFKACYRIGADGHHSNTLRDLNKIKFFVEREIARITKNDN